LGGRKSKNEEGDFMTKILIVEDEGVVAVKLKNTLAQLGYEVLEAVPTGEEAIQQAEQTNPDLVLIDIYLAGELNGIEAAAQIRSRFNIPVVYLTAYSSDEVVEQAKVTKPYGFLTKPVNEKELKAIIEMSFYRHQMETERKIKYALDSVRASVYDKMTDARDIQSVLVSLYEALKDIGISFADCSVQIVNEEEGRIEYLGIGPEGVHPVGSSDFTDSSVYEAWRNKRVLYRKDLEKEDRYTERAGLRRTSGKSIRSVVDVPYSHGTLALNSLEPNAFPEQDIKTLEMFASILSEGYTRYVDITERKHAEERLKSREQYYRSLLMNMHEDILVIDQDYRITDVNNNLLVTTGYKREEIIGRHCYEVSHGVNSPCDQHGEECLLREVFATGKARNCHHQHISTDGSKVWVDVLLSPLRNANGSITHIVEAARDITDTIRAQELLWESEKQMRLVVQNMPIMIDALDDNNNIIVWNRECERVTGYSADEIIGNPKALELLYPNKDYLQGLLAEWAKRGNSFRNWEMTIGCKDGTFKTVLWSNISDEFPVPGWASWAIGVDITEHKRIEETLQKSQKEFWELYDNAPVGYHQIDVNGNIVLVNQTEATLLGYTREEMLGCPIFDFIAEAERDMAKEAVREKIAQQQSTGSFERTYVRKDGSEISIAIEDRLVFDEQGRVVGIRSALQDISIRKQVEVELHETNRRLEETLAELRKTQQQFIQQERLRALGQMASGIAHDFNNALTPILTYTDLMLMMPDGLDDKEEVRDSLENINTAAKDAKAIVNRLREFYRHREENEGFRPINLNRLVEQAIELTQPRWREQTLASDIIISVETDLQKIPLVSGNEAELREVLTNLFLNAVDAMPTGGMITIRSYLDEEDVVLEVRDTGVGMTEEVKERCFEPFFSTKEEKGTGLGLAMVYGIIQRHKGTIKVDSEPDKGTIFQISLPISRMQQDEERVGEQGAFSRSLHILVVDDELPALDAVTKYLSADGHTFETATNGGEALEMFYEGRYDLVITDRAMPDMNGDRLARFIKRIAPNKPVIMLTGFGDIMKASGEMPANVDYLLSKPATLSDFREALEKAMAFRENSE